MTQLQDLSEDALALLRLFIQSGARKAGQSVTSELVNRRWRRPDSGLDAGLTELVAGGLVGLVEDRSSLACLTAEGETFVARHTRSCY